MLTSLLEVFLNIKKNIYVVFLLVFLFSFKIFEIENTFKWYAWGGLALKMNHYNLSAINIPKKMLVTTKDLALKQIHFNQFEYDFFFPLSIRGSFKYFYYRFPEIEEQTSLKICNFIKKEHEVEPEEIQIYSIKENVKTIHKRFVCK